MIKRDRIFFKEALAKMKESKEATEKFSKIRERMKEKGGRTSPLRKIMKEE